MLGPFKTLYIGYLAVWEVPVQELQFRLCFAWQSMIQERLSHRPGFAGLDQADPSLTREAYKCFSPVDQAQIRNSLCGTFFTEDFLYHISAIDSLQCIIVCGFVRSSNE